MASSLLNINNRTLQSARCSRMSADGSSPAVSAPVRPRWATPGWCRDVGGQACLRHGKVLIIGVDSNDEARSALRFLQTAGVVFQVASAPYPASPTPPDGLPT